MQGKKEYQEKLFNNFQLSDRIPKDNFYRRLKGALEIDFLYALTKGHYGESGQKSIDPVVFFKLCLVGYLENLISDRRLMEHCSMRLDILFFIGYDIDEELPWHSTISRTRQLFPESVFEEVFTKVLGLCIEKGMVSGHTQTIDSAPVKANASMDTLELKVPEDDLDEHLRKVRALSSMDKEEPHRKSKGDRSDKGQRSVTANKKELDAIKGRNRKWAKDQDQRPGAGNKGSKYTSNKTHYSPTDPDARISVKPGKARKLNYYSQISVDTDHQIITQIQADLADKKDNQYLQDLVAHAQNNLKQNGLEIENLLADAGYSSGENYAWLEKQNIKSYIPPHGTYKGGPEGFEYVKKGNYWLCPNDKQVVFKKQVVEKGTLKNHYRTSTADCKNCPLKKSCLSKSQYSKKISITAYRAEYERNNARLAQNKWHKSKRMSTVEPVFGTLINFLGMQKVNTRGLKQANKCMLMAATAFNLKKRLKYAKKPRISVPHIMKMSPHSTINRLNELFLSFIAPHKLQEV